MKKLMCGVLIVVMMLSLVACGSKLSGTYKSSLTGLVTYTFSGDKVTCKIGVESLAITIEGTYSIDGDKITLNWGEENSKNPLGNGEHTFEKIDEGIKIDGVTYEKQ